MFSRSVSATVTKNANRSLPCPLGSYVPARGPASISSGQVVGEHGEFGGVAAEPLHLLPRG
jgi:hypothetical protein